MAASELPDLPVAAEATPSSATSALTICCSVLGARVPGWRCVCREACSVSALRFMSFLQPITAEPSESKTEMVAYAASTNKTLGSAPVREGGDLTRCAGASKAATLCTRGCNAVCWLAGQRTRLPGRRTRRAT